VDLKITELGVKAEYVEDSKKVFKFFSFDKFKSLMLQEFEFDTGILPPGACMFNKSDNVMKLGIFCPGGMKDVKYNKRGNGERRITTSYNIFIPNTVWMHYFTREGVLQGSYLYTTPESFITLETMLYRYPFSNVGTGGSVCWGSSNMYGKKYDNMLGCASLIPLFYEQPFNKDLDDNMSRADVKAVARAKGLKPSDLEDGSASEAGDSDHDDDYCMFHTTELYFKIFNNVTSFGEGLYLREMGTVDSRWKSLTRG